MSEKLETSLNLQILKALSAKYPNDQELGAKVREFINNLSESK